MQRHEVAPRARWACALARRRRRRPGGRGRRASPGAPGAPSGWRRPSGPRPGRRSARSPSGPLLKSQTGLAARSGSGAMDEPRRVLEPVEHVRRAPDHERVVAVGVLHRRGGSCLGVDAGRAKRLGDPFGDPLRGAVAGRVGDEDVHRWPPSAAGSGRPFEHHDAGGDRSARPRAVRHGPAGRANRTGERSIRGDQAGCSARRWRATSRPGTTRIRTA